ncbi:unnamed protein product, partial [Polarella glacialis]
WRTCPQGIAQGCWLAIHGKVLQLPADFYIRHPGGMDIIMQFTGRDASVAFEEVKHSSRARRWASTYIIGQMDGKVDLTTNLEPPVPAGRCIRRRLLCRVCRRFAALSGRCLRRAAARPAA